MAKRRTTKRRTRNPEQRPMTFWKELGAAGARSGATVAEMLRPYADEFEELPAMYGSRARMQATIAHRAEQARIRTKRNPKKRKATKKRATTKRLKPGVYKASGKSKRPFMVNPKKKRKPAKRATAAVTKRRVNNPASWFALNGAKHARLRRVGGKLALEVK